MTQEFETLTNTYYYKSNEDVQKEESIATVKEDYAKLSEFVDYLLEKLRHSEAERFKDKPVHVYKEPIRPEY